MQAYYQPLTRQTHADGSTTARYRSTVHAQGAWNEHEQHMAPATGILAHELEHYAPHDHMRIGRISLDILGLIPFGEFDITTRTIRPGRTIELIEAQMSVNGRACIVARAWRMQTADTAAVAGVEDAPVAPPQDLPEFQDMQHWAGGYIRSLKLHQGPRRDGHGLVWLTNHLDMVAGEPVSDFVRLMGMVDTANGVVPRTGLPVRCWAFPNIDLQIHLYRRPQGAWLGLQTTQQFGSDGIGLTSSVLHDVHGPFGRSEQILTLRQMS